LEMKPTHQVIMALSLKKKNKNFKLRVFLFVLSSTDIFNFGLFILERITNLKPGEEQEDPERRYVE